MHGRRSIGWNTLHYLQPATFKEGQRHRHLFVQVVNHMSFQVNQSMNMLSHIHWLKMSSTQLHHHVVIKSEKKLPHAVYHINWRYADDFLNAHLPPTNAIIRMRAVLHVHCDETTCALFPSSRRGHDVVSALQPCMSVFLGNVYPASAHLVILLLLYGSGCFEM